MVKLVSELGPDIAEISRRLGQYKESVRYRYKEKILKRGFQVKAGMDYGALGLIRVVMKVRLSEAYSRSAKDLFDAMSELCYVTAYAEATPYDLYIVHGGVPAEFVGEFHALMESLKAKGIFAEVEYFDCDWFRVVPMRAECFDFEEGVWDFDWSNPPPVEDKAARATISERKKFDKVDLLLLKELWKDGDRSLMDIQAEIKKVNGIDVNYKTLGWHYSNHVVGNHLVKDYSITWCGLRYNADLNKLEKFAQHEYLGVSLIVRRTNEQDRMALRSALNRLPFLWSEAAGEAYYSQLFFPLAMVNEALCYLKKLLRPYGTRGELFLLDKKEMKSYTIGYNLWDEGRGRWAFDREAIAPLIERSAMSIAKRLG